MLKLCQKPISFQLSEWLLPGYDMMVEGGQAEGGDGVQTKEMRTEINGGSAQDPANFEVRQKKATKNLFQIFGRLQ